MRGGGLIRESYSSTQALRRMWAYLCVWEEGVYPETCGTFLGLSLTINSIKSTRTFAG